MTSASERSDLEPRYAVVDVETSGLRPGRDHVLQIAVVTVDAARRSRRSLDDARSTPPLVAPRRAAPHPRDLPANTSFGTRGAPSPHRTGDPTRPAACSPPTTPTSTPSSSSRRPAGRESPWRSSERLCTLDLSRRLDPDRQLTHGLAELCARYDVPLTAHHDALADATATAAVLPHLLRAHELSALDHS